jgi:hypothetical protein
MRAMTNAPSTNIIEPSFENSGEELLKLRKYLRRTGCTIALILWFMFLLTPCLIFVLAVQHEIILIHSDIPNDDFRMWLIMEPKTRGIAISNSRRIDAGNGTVCTIVDGRFLLWQGSAASPHYCSCYTKEGDNWSSVAEGADACSLAGENP